MMKKHSLSSSMLPGFSRALGRATLLAYLITCAGQVAAQDTSLPWSSEVWVSENEENWNATVAPPTILNSPSEKRTTTRAASPYKPLARRPPSGAKILVTGATTAKEATPQIVADATDDKQSIPVSKNAATRPAEADGTRDARVEELSEQKGDAGRSLPEIYCDVVIDAALAAKLAQEKRDAEDLKKEIESKLAELQAATNEQKKWLKMREDFQKKATDNLVTVYAEMDVEAAAQRLPAVGDEIAAAILVKMPTKSAGAILGEMPSEIAGRLTAYIAGAAELRPRTPVPDQKATQ